MATFAHASVEHTWRSHYRRLLILTVLSFIAMYVLMYVMGEAGIGQMKAILRTGVAPVAAEDSTAVALAVERFHRALAEGDTGAVLSLLSDDAMVLESGELETRDQYRSHHLPADIEFARAVPSVRRPSRVIIRGDVAWTSSTSTTRGVYRGRTIDSKGVELMVLTREQGGWRIRAIHWSSRVSRP